MSCHLGRKNCRIIDFQFGDYFTAFVSGAVFRSRVFPMVPTNVLVKLHHVTNVFQHSLNELSYEDIVHVYLIYMLEKGFNGRLAKQPVTEEYFVLLSNLDEFNGYNVVYFIIIDYITYRY